MKLNKPSTPRRRFNRALSESVTSLGESSVSSRRENRVCSCGAMQKLCPGKETLDDADRKFGGSVSPVSPPTFARIAASSNAPNRIRNSRRKRSAIARNAIGVNRQDFPSHLLPSFRIASGREFAKKQLSLSLSLSFLLRMEISIHELPPRILIHA